MKPFILLAFISSLFIPTTHAAVHSCDFKLPYEINIEDRRVEISHQERRLITIDQDNQLFIDGEVQVLDISQQRLVSQMGDGYRQLLPAIGDVAIEGANIGIKAATSVMNALFVDDPEFNQKILTRLDTLAEKFNKNVSANHLNGKTLFDSGFEKEFEQEIESMVEETVQKASGKVVVSILNQLLSTDPEEQNDLEFKMAMLAQDFESQIEADAHQLEKTAQRLCDQVAELDKIEESLRATHINFSEIDVIQTN